MSPRWLYWPATAAWTPAELVSLRAWYDASDTSTVTESSNLITAWNDKSGGGYHLSASGGARPTYTSGGLDGKHVVTFGGSQWLTASTASDWNFLHNTTGSTVVAVWRAGNTADPNATYALCGNSADTTSTHGIQFQYDDRSSIPRNNRFVVATSNGGVRAVANVSSDNAHLANSATVIAGVTDPANATASLRSFIYVNGGSAISNNSQTSSATSNDATHAFQLGAGGNNAIPLTGYIAEVVIANAKLSDADREKVEGYLAHKWGLESNLPSTHPYRNSAP